MPVGVQTADTGRHWSRCKLKIGSNVHPKQICRVGLGIDWRETRKWGLHTAVHALVTRRWGNVR